MVITGFNILARADELGHQRLCDPSLPPSTAMPWGSTGYAGDSNAAAAAGTGAYGAPPPAEHKPDPQQLANGAPHMQGNGAYAQGPGPGQQPIQAGGMYGQSAQQNPYGQAPPSNPYGDQQPGGMYGGPPVGAYGGPPPNGAYGGQPQGGAPPPSAYGAPPPGAYGGAPQVCLSAPSLKAFECGWWCLRAVLFAVPGLNRSQLNTLIAAWHSDRCIEHAHNRPWRCRAAPMAAATQARRRP